MNIPSWEYELYVATLILGIVTISLAIMGLCLTFALFLKERSDRLQAATKAHLNLILTKELEAFKALDQFLNIHEELKIQEALNIFDVYTKICLDNFNPLIYASQHSYFQTRAYKKMMIATFKNSLPIAVEYLEISLRVDGNSLIEAQKNHNSEISKLLRKRLTTEQKRLQEKVFQNKNLRKQPRAEVWVETNQSLKNFREALSMTLQKLIDNYSQFQISAPHQRDLKWANFTAVYQASQVVFRQFRGNLESIFIDF